MERYIGLDAHASTDTNAPRDRMLRPRPFLFLPDLGSPDAYFGNHQVDDRPIEVLGPDQVDRGFAVVNNDDLILGSDVSNVVRLAGRKRVARFTRSSAIRFRTCFERRFAEGVHDSARRRRRQRPELDRYDRARTTRPAEARVPCAAHRQRRGLALLHR